MLGIETATQVCAVALCRGDDLIAETRLNIGRVHSEKLAGVIDNLSGASDFRLADVSGVAVSIGPGSFTGLRIGLSVAKGLAFALGKPLVAISTLAALAAQAPLLEGTVCAVVASRKGEVFAALFERRGLEVVRKSEDLALPLERLPEVLSGPALVVGEGAERVESLGLPEVRIAPEPFRLSSAFSVARLGAEKLRRREVEDLATLEPAYLKAFQPGARNR